MSPGKKTSEVKLTGRVQHGIFAAGSKSEHDAVYIETTLGSFVLRRKGENPFSDPVVRELAGKTITARGFIQGYVFMATSIRENPDTEKNKHAAGK